MGKPRTWAQACADPRVESFSDERGTGDGLWLYLAEPYYCPDTETGTVHEFSVREVLDSLERCVPNYIYYPDYPQ